MSLSSSPSVSVIVPLYNKRNTLQRTLRSILDQTFGDLELLVVDDESTDGSLEEVSKFSDPRVRILTQKNAGPGAARNHGMRESHAPLVAFLDADDEWLPDFLHSTVTWLEQNPECDAACSGRFWDPGRISRESFSRSIGISEGPWKMDPRTPPQRFRELAEFFFSCSVVAKKDVLLQYGGFYENRCTFQEDTYLWLQVVMNHTTYRDPKPLMIWHRENSELSTGRKHIHPVSPILTDPDPIRRSCPQEYCEAFENYLSHYALTSARRFAWEGDSTTARMLLKRFPSRGDDTRQRRVVATLANLWPLIRLSRSVPGIRPTLRRLRGIGKVAVSEDQSASRLSV